MHSRWSPYWHIRATTNQLLVVGTYLLWLNPPAVLKGLSINQRHCLIQCAYFDIRLFNCDCSDSNFRGSSCNCCCDCVNDCEWCCIAFLHLSLYEHVYVRVRTSTYCTCRRPGDHANQRIKDQNRKGKEKGSVRMDFFVYLTSRFPKLA